MARDSKIEVIPQTLEPISSRGPMRQDSGILKMALQRANAVVRVIYRVVIPYKTRVLYWAYRRRRHAAIIERAETRDARFMSASRAELKRIVSLYPDAKGVVIFPPSIDWDTPLFQRPQQMALAFAALGYLVLYSARADSPSELPRFHMVTDRHRLPWHRWLLGKVRCAYGGRELR